MSLPCTSLAPFDTAVYLQFLALQSHNPDMEKSYYESLLIVLDTLEKCLSGPAKDTTRFDEALNVKLLLREICQFVCKYFVVQLLGMYYEQF